MNFLLFHLTFSDSAKFYEAAKNLLAGDGLTIHHSFFSSSALASYQPGQSWPANFLPLNSLLMAGVFKFLPINDFTIAIIGYLFLTICLLLIFLIAKRLHSTRAGIFSAMIFSSSLFFLEYAQNASSEIFFTTQILLFVFLSLQKNKIRYLSILPLSLMFLTRQQAILFLLALPTYFVLFHLKSWRSRLIAILPIVIVLSGLYLVAKRDVSSIYSPLKPFYSAQAAAGVSQGLYLRGQEYVKTAVTTKSILSKVFYNLYNFAKNPERLAPSTIFFLFILSHFSSKNRRFTLFTATVLATFILGAAASLPNARYVHPIIPLVIISASLTLIQILEKFSPRHINLKLLIIIIFLSLPSLGHFTLDARFRRQQFNLDKPTTYRQISQILAKDIPKGQLIITNLDAWAAWYEGLTTMWFPASPNLLTDYQDKINYIAITNYLENDGDFALGEWKEVVYTPETINNKFLKSNYKILKTFVISPDQVYENREYKGTILVRSN